MYIINKIEEIRLLQTEKRKQKQKLHRHNSYKYSEVELKLTKYYRCIIQTKQGLYTIELDNNNNIGLIPSTSVFEAKVDS